MVIMVSRRAAIAGSSAALVVGMPISSHADEPHAASDAGRGRGPKVWLDMDQAELDDAYTQLVYAPNLAQIVARYESDSAAVRDKLGPPKRFSYGPSRIEGFDLFATKAPNAPIVVMVHGGAWRTGTANQFCYAAENFVHAGAHFVVLDFVNIDEAKGELTTMAEQVRHAIAAVFKDAPGFGGDRNRIYVIAHSSGSHLAGVAMITDWTARGLPADLIKGAVLCSGLYDMKPVRLSVRSTYVRFTDDNEDTMSAQRHLDRWTAPVALIYGDKETPEFQRQSRDFHAALKAAGKPSSLTLARNYNHFELPETFANPFGIAGRIARQQFALA